MRKAAIGMSVVVASTLAFSVARGQSASGPFVDVWLNGGPAGQCVYGSTDGCALYTATIDLATRELVSNRKIGGGGPGVLFPQLDPNGNRVAVLAKESAKKQPLRIFDLRTTTWTDVTSGTGDGAVHFFAWHGSGLLAYSHVEEGGDAYWNDMWETKADGSTAPAQILGGGKTSDFSFADPQFHPKNSDVVLVHGRAKTEEQGNAVPAVVDLVTREISRATLPDMGGGVTMAGCAHGAWHPGGNRFICSEQKTAKVKEHEIYAFEKKGDGWASTGPAFTHMKLAEAIERRGYDAQCTAMGHKYAEYCGDGNHIVANVYCAGTNEGEGTWLTSKMMYIDISDPTKPKYTDITGSIGKGMMSIGSASCSATRATQ